MSKAHPPQEAILQQGRVRFLLRRLTQAALEVFTHIYDQTRQHVREKHEEHLLDEYWRACLPSVKLWNTELQKRLADAVTAQVDGILDLADFAFLKYCQLNYGRDVSGNVNVLRVTKPPFTELYHRFLCRLAFTPEVIRQTALANSDDLERACSGALCDALYDVACSRFVIVEVVPAAEWARRKSERPSSLSSQPQLHPHSHTHPHPHPYSSPSTPPSASKKPTSGFTPSFDSFYPERSHSAVSPPLPPSPPSPPSPPPSPRTPSPPSPRVSKPQTPLKAQPLPARAADSISATWHESLIGQGTQQHMRRSVVSMPSRTKATTLTTPRSKPTELTPLDSTSQINSFAKTYQKQQQEQRQQEKKQLPQHHKPPQRPPAPELESLPPALPPLPSKPPTRPFAKVKTPTVVSDVESVRSVKPAPKMPPGVSIRMPKPFGDLETVASTAASTTSTSSSSSRSSA